MSDQLDVYVPAEDSDLRAHIQKGSGVVGSEVADTGRIRLDFEGNQELFPAFADRVRRAAERHTWEGRPGEGYPTEARGFADPQDVVHIGWYDRRLREVEVDDLTRLARWLGVDQVEEGELVAAP